MQFIDGILRAEKRIVVHCNSGRHRSPAVCAAYLLWARKKSLAQAAEMVDPSMVPFLEAVA